MEIKNSTPLKSILLDHLYFYPSPQTLNYFWSFGFLSGCCLIFQLLSGIFLSLHYQADTNLAFFSVTHIMENVQYGWFFRYLHANIASFFFICLYIHLFRNIFYTSYSKPLIAVWYTGIILFLLVMTTAFLGYVLPWGQMSFWGATVITNLASSIPYYGSDIVIWIWGGFSVSKPTLIRFYSFHFLLPFIILGVIFLHLIFLHNSGSNNPLGFTEKSSRLSFFPYLVMKDLYILIIFFIFLLVIGLFYPNILNHCDNYIKANSMVTPAHIVPEWYFLPFYAILRAIPSKLGGVIAMLASILILFTLPYNAIFYTRSQYFYYTYLLFFWCFLVLFGTLGWFGQKGVGYPFTFFGITLTAIYFNLFKYVFLTKFYITLNNIKFLNLAQTTYYLLLFNKNV